MRAVEGSLDAPSKAEEEEQEGTKKAWRFPVLAQRAASEGPRWTRAVGDHLV